MADGLMNGEDRQTYGIIASFKNADGDRINLHENGPITASLVTLCERALKVDDTFRVTAISSPEYIWRDLKGRGRRNVRGQSSSGAPAIPEPRLLGGVGLIWMLHPDLLGSTAKPQRRPA